MVYAEGEIILPSVQLIHKIDTKVTIESSRRRRMHTHHKGKKKDRKSQARLEHFILQGL